MTQRIEVCYLYKGGRECLSDKVTLEQRSKGKEEETLSEDWEEWSKQKGHKCKGPEAGYFSGVA